MKHTYQGGLLIVNSKNSPQKIIDYLKDYTKISLFLDKQNRQEITSKILNVDPHAKDFLNIYFNPPVPHEKK